MKKTRTRWLAAALAAAMLTGGLVASAATQSKAEGDVNLARLDGVVATASDTDGSTFTADRTIDGDYSNESRWGSNNDGKGTTERTLTLNLGAKRTINSFKVFWENTNIRDYVIETSVDNTQWDEQVNIADAQASKEAAHTLDSSVVAQYVRLRVTKYAAAVGTWYNVGVREFEVYGSEEVAPTIGNLATLDGVTATASDTEVAKYPASATIDGDTSETSRWGTNNDGKGTTERTLTLNLGEARTITGFKVFYEKSNIKDYFIETSTNGTNWDKQVEITDNTDLEPAHDLTQAVTAQYVRLRVTRYGESVTGWYNVGVREFEVYGHMPEDSGNPGGGDVVTLPEGTNIARQSGVTASATNVESGTQFTADKARDGDKTSKNSRWATDQNVQNPTITYNLGATYNVRSVILYWENNNADKWHVQTSMDGKEWTTQKSFEGKLPVATAPIQTVNFDQTVQAQYVRVWIEAYSADWNNVSMYEFEVYQEQSKEVVTPATAAAALANSLKIQDGKVVMTGEKPSGYDVFWGCNYEQVVGADGTIYTPLVDTQVELSVTVREQGNTTNCGTSTVKMTIPGAKTANEGNQKPAVVPELAQWYSTAQQKDQFFTLTADSRIVASQEFSAVAQELQADIRDLFGLNLSVVTDTPKAGDISLAFYDQGGFDQETYNMVVTDQVVIQANHSTGAYWGTRSVLQSLKLSGNLTIAQGTARDYPEFENRGFMLDVGRKPVSMETLKEISKTMAWFKMNSFHVHLSDNLIFMEDYGNDTKDAWDAYQGFRLESNKEGLTSKDYYYTKEEFKEFMSYSRALGVDIVPEIDVPAHALSVSHYVKYTLNRPDLVLDKIGTYGGTTRPWFDHVDISKQEGIDIVKTIFDEYIDCGIFDENTIVHIGADEFYDSAPAYRNFLKEMINYIGEEKGLQVRVWGSLSQMSGGEGSPFTADDVKGAQMNIWNTGWANPQQMFNLGFGLINTIDGQLYMVPNGNGNQGGYGDYLNTQNLYNNWEPENYGGTWIPSGSSQMLGACYAIWNDNIDTRAAGINETDTFTRFADALPYLGTKMWGTGGDGLDRDYNTLKANVSTLGTAPNTNPYHTIDLADGTQAYAQYTFADTQDRSGNSRNLALSGAAALTDGSLVLSGANAFAPTGMDVMGPQNTVTLRVYKDSAANSGEQILLETDAAYGEHTVKAIANQDGTWKLGFARELYEYVFDYNLPCDEWVELTITNQGNKTKLLVDGKTLEAVGSFLPDEHATTQFKGKTGITYSAFDIPVSRIGSETNAFQGKVDSVVFHANGVTPETRHLVTFNSNGGSSVAAVSVVDGQTVAEPQAPVWEGHTFLGWYTDEGCTNAYDFASPVTGDLTLFAKWEAGVVPTPTPTPQPTTEPSAEPSAEPSVAPTAEPSVAPTAEPSAEPSVAPTAQPTPQPTQQPSGDVILDNQSGTPITAGNASQVFDKGTVVKVDHIQSGEIYQRVEQALKDVVSSMDQAAIYEFTATLNGAAVQPTAPLQVTMQIPANFSVNNLKLYYVAENGAKEEVPITVNKDARTITVNLQHFSTYVLADTTPASNVPPTGDASQLLLYVVALAGAAVVLSVTASIWTKTGKQKK